VVVGLGPADADLFTAATSAAIAAGPRRYLRTARHPAASSVPGAVSFDAIYETAESLDEVYAGIVDALVEAAADGDVLYAVPGSPMVAERTVELLLADDRVAVEVVPAMSFLDLVWARLGVDPVRAGVRLIDGHRFGVEAAGERGPLLVVQCDTRSVLSGIKLAVDQGPDVVVLHHLGLDDESVRPVPWAELDRDIDADHLTSVYIPVLAEPVAGEVARFAELVRTLRSRCPWDREQTHQTLTRHLLEETYEVLEAIEALDGPGPADDAFAHLEEELGDLLFQVVFHATLGAEEGRFTLADVARGIHDKLVHRHPHVFGSVEAETPGQVIRNWEQIKKAEKGHSSLMEGVSGDLPSLLYAHKVQRKAASLGLDWDQPDQAGPDPGHAEVGLVLFSAVDWARRLGVDPEAALRGTAGAFRRRFEAMEAAAADEGTDLAALTPEELAARWARTSS
jgi:tetrapyrrole methylase family protein/MazG family protein